MSDGDTLTLPKSAFTRIALLQTALLVSILIFLGLSVRSELREMYLKNLYAQVSDVVDIVGRQFPDPMPKDWCEKVGKGTVFRLSVISSDTGKIRCDNIYKIEDSFTSILNRPEIQDAIRSPNRRGQSFRTSSLSNNLLRIYSTLYVPGQKLVIRVGFTLEALEQNLGVFDRMFLIAIVFLSFAMAIVLQWTTRGPLFNWASSAVDRTRRKMQENFVANVSHEFRTPLTSIRGFADAALQDWSAGRNPERAHVEIIRKDADRLLSMVDDLLDLSAIDAGSISLNKEEIDPRVITEDALTRLQMVYGKKNQEVFENYRTDTVFADPDRLYQIVVNLIGNGMKYAPEGGSIWLDWSVQPDGFARFDVSDDGPGIPAAEQAKLFQRFGRASTSAKLPGTGLGLAIVKGLVESHGGTVQLRPREGGGTCFTIRIPPRPV